MIIENIEDGYHEVDIKGNFTFVNESICKMIGYEREELLGMNNRPYADKENARKVYQTYKQVYLTGKPVKNFEWQIIRKDGVRRDVEVSISLIRDSEGQPTGFRGIARDITDRRRAEEEKRILEERLQHADKMEAIGTLAGGIAHDFNNLLVGILGNADLAMEGAREDERVSYYLADIMAAARSAANLCKQMLAYAGKSTILLDDVNLNQVIEHVHAMVRGSIAAKARVLFELSQNAPTMHGDASQIEQVVLNLIMNAADAVGDAGGTSFSGPARSTAPPRSWRSTKGARSSCPATTSTSKWPTTAAA